MTRGRPPLGSELVDRLDGSLQAKSRLRAILQTLSGELAVAQACAELGIGHSRFHDMRSEVLQNMLWSLEGKPRGRPSNSQARHVGLQELQEQVLALTADLRASQIREELAIMLPRLARNPDGISGRKKKGRHR